MKTILIRTGYGFLNYEYKAHERKACRSRIEPNQRKSSLEGIRNDDQGYSFFPLFSVISGII